MNWFRVRYAVLLIGVGLIFLAIFARLTYLMVVQHDMYLDRSNKQIQKLIKIDTSRGKIFDRHMYPLAVSEPVYSVYASPRRLENKADIAQQLGPILGMSEQDILKKINSSANFVWLKRKISGFNVEALESFPKNQINVLIEEKRVFPNGLLTADVLGGVGMDAGLAGLEYQFDQFLTGEHGYYIIQGDPSGVRIISSNKTLLGQPKGFSVGNNGIEASSLKGGNLVTTIDHRVQYLVESLLQKNIHRVEAKAGQVIVLDVQNGDIIAMADYPFYNPNLVDSVDYSTVKNSCIVDVFEPGSIFKLITYAAALEEKIVTPGTVMAIPETMTIQTRTIREAHDRDDDDPDEYSAQDIIKKSMNVGTVQLAQKMGVDVFYHYIQSFGFGQRSNILLPGETSGLVRRKSTVQDIDLAVMSFGQGISVTGLQMVAAIASIGNGGMLVEPRIIKHQTDHDSLTLISPSIRRKKRVISKQTATDVLAAMESVVVEGTGQYANVNHYRVGGKTGTAQKPLENGRGYQKDAYIASFVGIVPIQAPRFAILVVIHEPKTTIWGSTAAAPLFSEISKVLIDYYDIEPDLPNIDVVLN